jgi:hypothetical protein
MRIQVLTAVTAVFLGTSWLLAQDPKPSPDPTTAPGAVPEPFPAGSLDHEDLTVAVKRVAEAHPETVRVRGLARSGQGRDVWLVTVGRAETKGGSAKPAVLIVANLEADHVVGSHVALRLVERLAESDGKDPAITALLDRRTIHVVPRLNPDGAERLLTGKPRTEFRTNLTPVDRDRDRRADEDGPDDLDGDGLITRMRVKDEKATLIADAKDSRILRKADPVKGERALFSDHAEGRDDDGDGQIDEDPAGGVNLNRNWPHRWTDFDPETGHGPASEPEVHALIAWAFDHPEIAAVWTFGLNDNLKVEPRKPASALDNADLPYFAELSKIHAKGERPAARTPAKKAAEPDKKGEASQEKGKEAEKDAEKDQDADKEAEKTKAAPPAATTAPTPEDRTRMLEQFKAASPEDRTRMLAQLRTGGGGPGATPPAPAGVVGIEGTTDGAMSEWAYYQFGSIGLASRLWPVPDVPNPPTDPEARWLLWNDRVMGGRAFVPLHEVDHPTLGKVTVGGWKPGVRLNPPADKIAAIVDTEFAFLKELASKLPSLTVPDVKVESKGGGLFEIKAVVANDGYLPTALAQGVRTRKAPPILVRLKAGDAKLLAGKPLERIATLAGSGGRVEYRWLLLAPEGLKSATLEVSCPKAGRVVKDIELK